MMLRTSNSLAVVMALVLGGLSGSAAQAAPSYKIISDLDDTLKLSHIENKLAAGFNGLFTSRAFAGGATWFRGASAQGAETIVLSASPKFLRKKIESFMEKNHFPSSRIYLKNKMSDDTAAYKTARLEAIAAEDEAPFVLFSDDTEKDPEIFARFAETHPGRVAAIYIRKNLNRPLPQGVIPISSTFEIGLQESTAGRLPESEVIQIAGNILRSKDRLVLPRFSSCEEVGSHLAQGGALQAVEVLVNQRLQAICYDSCSQ